MLCFVLRKPKKNLDAHTCGGIAANGNLFLSFLHLQWRLIQVFEINWCKMFIFKAELVTTSNNCSRSQTQKLKSEESRPQTHKGLKLWMRILLFSAFWIRWRAIIKLRLTEELEHVNYKGKLLPERYVTGHAQDAGRSVSRFQPLSSATLLRSLAVCKQMAENTFCRPVQNPSSFMNTRQYSDHLLYDWFGSGCWSPSFVFFF